MVFCITDVAIQMVCTVGFQDMTLNSQLVFAAPQVEDFDHVTL